MSRWNRLALVIAGFTLPWMIWASLRIDMNSGGVTNWLPEGRPARLRYDQFVEQFGVDDYLIISWPGCTLDDPCVAKFAEALRERPATSAVVRDVKTGQETVEELTSPPLRLSRADAIDRLQGILVGPDRETTCLIVRTEKVGTDPAPVFDLICRTAEEVCGKTRDDLRIGGSTFEAVSINEASSRAVRRYAVPAGLASLIIAALFLRDVRTTVSIFAVSAFSQLMAIGVLDLTLGRMNVLLIVMPTLVYVLTMSGAIHLVNYCLDEARDVGLGEGVRLGMRAGRVPCLLASVTTAIGLLSLCVSQVHPVREFGFYAALCLVLSLLVLFFLLPGCLLWRIGSSHWHTQTEPPKFTVRVKSGLMCVAEAVLARPGVWAVSLIVLLVVGAIGLKDLRTVVDFDQMFPEQSEVIRNYTWLEDHIGPMIPIEMLIDVPADSHRTTRERVELVQDIEQELAQLPFVTGTLSAATFVPSVTGQTTLQTIIRNRLSDQQLDKRLESFKDDGLLFSEHGQQRWRVTFRLPARGVWDYFDLSRQATETAEAIVANQDRWRDQEVQISTTGMMPLKDETNQQLFEDLARSYLTAFVLICPLMMIILRSFSAGVVAMLPNVMPTLLVFGALGWLGRSVDIGTVLCASVALGIAVDDTVHFLTWFRRGLSDGLSRVQAVRFAYDRCALAMLQTTLICGCGMLIFGLSDFVPASHFAILLAILLATALAGDLLLLPALLCSPVGRLFERGTHQRVSID
ncbi:MAG: MMPL family transporter [Planctomycetaceae bacterium]